LASMFLSTLAMGMAGLALPLYALELRADYTAIGMLGVAYVVSNAFLSVPSGRFADRRGRKPLLLLGFFLTACVLWAYSLVGVVWLLLALRVVQGAAEAPIWVNAQAATADLSPPSKRGRAMGIYGTSWAVGFAIGPLFGGLSYASLGAVPTFQASALVALAAVAVLATMGLPAPKAIGGKIRLKGLAPACSIGLIYVGVVAVIFILFPAYASRRVAEGGLGMSPSDIGLLLAVFMGIRGLLFVPMGRLSDRLGPNPVIRAGLLGLVVGVAGLAFATNHLLIALVLILLAIAEGAVYPAVMSIVTQVNGGRNRGYVLGIFNAVAMVGWGLMPGVGGVLADTLGPTIPYLACAIFAAPGLLVLGKLR